MSKSVKNERNVIFPYKPTWRHTVRSRLLLDHGTGINHRYTIDSIAKEIFDAIRDWYLILALLDSSLLFSLYNKFIALQSLCPHTIICLILFTIQPSSSAAGSQLVISSAKYWEWGITFPAFRTEIIQIILLLWLKFYVIIINKLYYTNECHKPTNISPTLVSVNLVGIILLSMHV